MEVSQWSQFHVSPSLMGKNASPSLGNLFAKPAHFFTPPHGKNPKKMDSFDLMAARNSKYTGQSVRAIPMRILTVGKKRSHGVQILVEEYMEKINYYCSIEDVHLKSNPRNSSNVKTQIEDEDMATMKQIKPEDWVVMLDEHGINIGSEEMADLLGDAGNTGSTRLSFCIGGPYGHGPQVRERADIAIKLSSLVLNHQVALIVLLEQLYRSLVAAGA